MAAKTISGTQLDKALALGFYRMQQELFTTPFIISEDGNITEVFWLRTILNECTPPSQHPVYKKNKHFSVTFSKAKITAEIEDLFRIYRRNVKFDAPESVQSYLCGDLERKNEAFDSYTIEIRDGKQLIAIGYFDKGKKSITGIMNFYHPEYKKYSLGKFLMLLKMEYAISQEMDYYYTGYIAIDNSRFDYKVFPDTDIIEVYLPSKDKWIPYPKTGKEGLNEFTFLRNLEL